MVGADVSGKYSLTHLFISDLHLIDFPLSCICQLRMFTFMCLAYFCDYYRTYLVEHREYNDRMRSIRNTIEAFGLVWFVVGNMWLFGDDNNICHHPERSPIYNLCVSLLVLNYVQICFPCIIAIVLIPVFCFCMPCLIRILARLQDPRASVVSIYLLFTSGALTSVYHTVQNA